MELQTIKQAMVKFIKDEEGLTVVEYAVAGGLISLAVVAAFQLLGTNVGIVINALAGIIGATPGAGG
ncbi:Flp family type IVb pilin [Pseudomonas sp. MAP12]|uniref:Flp family type IVb pilin n=1 Tax=Geopseudomonas aromaticivorans TaxID=2849492 RepID=A0ABS6N1Z2_9GAMM|nr:Flp family type IVb pilin [Pseudomonas aromaticivorans]MBV2134522.1 Flp family type IVb pilin [Pseudomonas aromaticivorans]